MPVCIPVAIAAWPAWAGCAWVGDAMWQQVVGTAARPACLIHDVYKQCSSILAAVLQKVCVVGVGWGLIWFCVQLLFFFY